MTSTTITTASAVTVVATTNRASADPTAAAEASTTAATTAAVAAASATASAAAAAKAPSKPRITAAKALEIHMAAARGKLAEFHDSICHATFSGYLPRNALNMVLLESAGAELWPLIHQLGCKNILCLNKPSSSKLDRCRLKATDFTKTTSSIVSVVTTDIARLEAFQQLHDQKLIHVPESISAFISWFSLGSLAGSRTHLRHLCIWIAAHLAPGGVWIASGLDAQAVLTALGRQQQQAGGDTTSTSTGASSAAVAESKVAMPRLDFAHLVSIQLLSAAADAETFATIGVEWSNGTSLSEALVPTHVLEQEAARAGLRLVHSSLFEEWDMLATSEMNQEVQGLPVPGGAGGGAGAGVAGAGSAAAVAATKKRETVDAKAAKASVSIIREYSFLHRSVVLLKV